jgi:hypothetical protein
MQFGERIQTFRRNLVISFQAAFKMEATGFSETLVTTHQTTHCHNAGDHGLGSYRREPANVTSFSVLEFHRITGIV